MPRVLRLTVNLVFLISSLIVERDACSGGVNSSGISREYQQILLTEPFVPAAKVDELPEGIRQLFAHLIGGNFDMANPGMPYQEGCIVIKPRLPERRLIFAGVSPKYCLIQYERGGKRHLVVLVLFQMNKGVSAKLIWTGCLSDEYTRSSTVEQLRAAVKEHRIRSCGISTQLP